MVVIHRQCYLPYLQQFGHNVLSKQNNPKHPVFRESQLHTAQQDSEKYVPNGGTFRLIWSVLFTPLQDLHCSLSIKKVLMPRNPGYSFLRHRQVSKLNENEEGLLIPSPDENWVFLGQMVPENAGPFFVHSHSHIALEISQFCKTETFWQMRKSSVSIRRERTMMEWLGNTVVLLKVGILVTLHSVLLLMWCNWVKVFCERHGAWRGDCSACS